jgi:hypothetical protein
MPPVMLPSKGGVRVRFGLTVCLLSLRERRPSGPRENWGHSDGFSRVSAARVENEERGDVCERCAKSSAAEEVDSYTTMSTLLSSKASNTNLARE